MYFAGVDCFADWDIRWMSAGRLWYVTPCLIIRQLEVTDPLRYRDILNELASVGELPPAENANNNKRERGSDSPMSSAISSAPSPADSFRQSSSPALSDPRRPIAGRRSLGSTPTLSVSQAPSVASSSTSPSNVPGGLPRGSEPLATPDIARGGMQLMNDGSLSGMVPSPTWIGSPSDGISQTPLPFGNATPNLNIFDLFQSDPSMFGMLDSTFTQDAQQAQPQAQQKSQSSWAMSDPTAHMPEMIMPLEGTAIGDALQMWTDAPIGFE